MTRKFLPFYTIAFLSAFAVGCETQTSTPSGGRVDVDVRKPDGTPRGQIDVNAGPGGVDVEVERDGKKPVDVDVAPGGGVNVDVDGGAIRDGIRERREERKLEKAAE